MNKLNYFPLVVIMVLPLALVRESDARGFGGFHGVPHRSMPHMSMPHRSVPHMSMPHMSMPAQERWRT